MGSLHQPTLVAALSALLFAGATAPPAARAQAGTAAAVPSADSLMRHVYVLADDSMMGRGTGSEGYDRAARYVTTVLQNYAVGPDPSQRGHGLERYFQHFRYELPQRGGKSESLESYNVIGLVRGTDRGLSSERVVVGAHLDHVGVVDGMIFNGASDNASGVAVMLEVARLISRTPPRRTVLFVAFGAEERGLLGSKAFAEAMANSRSRIVADINIDDVGHLRTGTLGPPILAALHGESMCGELYSLVKAYGDESHLTVTDSDDNNLFARSDHYSFYQVGIPVLDFGAGFVSTWLHTPEDDPEAMDGNQLQRVATVVYQAVRTVAESIGMCKSR
jgi:Zn-dependent M28 family amino/carboxypeptidase